MPICGLEVQVLPIGASLAMNTEHHSTMHQGVARQARFEQLRSSDVEQTRQFFCVRSRDAKKSKVSREIRPGKANHSCKRHWSFLQGSHSVIFGVTLGLQAALPSPSLCFSTTPPS